MPSGLTTRYKCDETSGTTLTDSVGSNNGTLTGSGISFIYDNSIQRYVLSKDSNNVDAYVSIPLLFSVKDYSVGFWKKFTDTESMVWYLKFGGYNTNSYSIWVTQTVITIQRNTSPYRKYHGYKNVDGNKYTHFGFSMEDNGDGSGDVKFYVNGKLIATETIPSGTWVTGTPSHNILLSQKTMSNLYYSGSGRFFEFCFFNNKVLSDSEFSQMYFETNPYTPNNTYSIFDDCVAFFDFKKDDKDVMNNTTPFFPGGKALTTNRLNQLNSAYDLLYDPGIPSRIELYYNDYISEVAGTISMWVKTNSFSVSLIKGYFDSNPASNGSLRIYVSPSSTSLLYYEINGSTAASVTHGMNTNDFYFLTLVWDGNDTSIYINSIHKGTTTNSQSPVIGEFLPFTLGTTDGQTLDFILDSTYIFDKALSADEIKQLYNLTKNKEIHPIIRGGRK